MITYLDSTKGITSDMLSGFFQGWKQPRTPQEHLRILESSDFVVLALDTESSRVGGFIPLLEVLPEYRNQGMPSALLARMLERLTSIPAIDITCDPGMQSLYSRFGMTPSVGMVIRNP